MTVETQSTTTNTNDKLNESSLSSWDGWDCDDLTPNLCDFNVTTGMIPIRGINVTYWKYEKASMIESKEQQQQQQQKNPPVPPIIAIHGGPGFPHNYMLPFKQLACNVPGRSVIFYDQAGCGESKLPNSSSSVKDTYPWLLDPFYYSLEELPTIIHTLNLKEYHIIGSSWGTILSQIFALNYYNNTNNNSIIHSGKLLSMVLSGPLSDTQHYIQAQWDPIEGNLGTLPPYLQKRIHQLEFEKAYNTKEYEAIDKTLGEKFTCRTAPEPKCLVDSRNKANQEIYVAMQGESEFTTHGVLEHFNVTKQLSTLTELPVLLSSGKYDTMRRPAVLEMYQALPIVEWVYLERSGHTSMLDEPGPMNDAIEKFISRVESAHDKNQPFIPLPLNHSTDLLLAATQIADSNTMWYHSSQNHLSFLIASTAILSLILGWFLGSSFSSNRKNSYTAL